MEAVARGWDISIRRAVALFLGLVAIAVLAGAAGGYLTRGSTTRVVTQTIYPPLIQSEYPAAVWRTTAGYIPGL
jgi:hypothetical protein